MGLQFKMKTTVVIILGLVSSALANTVFEDCEYVEYARDMVDNCYGNSFRSVPAQHHLRVTGMKKGQRFKDEEIFLQLQILTGLPRGNITACLKMMPLCPPNSYDCGDTYASIDGTCNNIANPRWGATDIAYLRDLPAVYADGVESLRKATDGSDLPNPRHVSNTVLSQDKDLTSPTHTRWVAVFGQLLAHDFAKTTVTTDVNDNPIDCCHEPTFRTCKSQCLRIDVTEDPHFTTVNQCCINFVRSVPATCDNCQKIPTPCIRNQLNELSAFIDASGTYGDIEKEHRKLRAYIGGKMKVGSFKGPSNLAYLPADEEEDACKDGGKTRPCYLAGDTRVNIENTLQAAATIFLREHNRVADKLHDLNRHWDDEKIFQESRKIVIAELQHFSFKDYMETVLGKDLAMQYGLDEKDGYDSVYNATVDPGLSNHFGAAAFRFGHSLGTSLQGQHKKENNQPLKPYRLADAYFRVANTYKDEGMDGHVRFLQESPMGEADGTLSDDVRQFLFLSQDTAHRFDLGALNTQRGRDHGLANYNQWKRWCGQELFPANHSTIMADKIRSVYNSEDDIDLFVGGLTEKVIPGAVVGPLFGCMIGRQFQRLKTGDRYEFENPPDSTTSVGRFTEAQVRSIKQFTFASLICKNTDTVLVQRNIFRQTSPGNPRVRCDSGTLPDIDFSLWTDVRT